MKLNSIKYVFMLISIILLISGCDTSNKTSRRRSTYFIGIDVSGSFTRTKSFRNSLRFLSYYIYGHLSAKGNLGTPKDLYVGGIGGDEKEEPQAFFPIHDFQDKTPKQIEKKLKKEFGNQKDNLTDFNTYFDRVSTLVKQKNLVLAPITIILISDGVPEILRGKTGKIKYQAYSKNKTRSA